MEARRQTAVVVDTYQLQTVSIAELVGTGRDFSPVTNLKGFVSRPSSSDIVEVVYFRTGEVAVRMAKVRGVVSSNEAHHDLEAQ